MDNLLDHIGAMLAAIVTALGGFYMYERKTTNDRLTKIEEGIAKHQCDIAVIQSQYKDLKDDTQEIKDAQKVMLDLLTMKRQYRGEK